MVGMFIQFIPMAWMVDGGFGQISNVFFFLGGGHGLKPISNLYYYIYIAINDYHI